MEPVAESTRPGSGAHRIPPGACAALVLALGACAPSPAATGPGPADSTAGERDGPAGEVTGLWPARWHVRGGFIRDAQGRAVILRGVNIAHRHKSKPYFDFHKEADFARVRQDWGMNAVRFLISWAAVEPARGSYSTSYLEEVARRMEWAASADLLLVLDMHQDLYGEGFAGGNGAPRWTCDESRYTAFKPVSPWFANYASPQVIACFDGLFSSSELRQHYAEAWRQVARRLVGHEGILGFDVINEPHWGSYNIFEFEKKRLQPFYDKVVQAVRGAAPCWLAFLEPASSRNLGIPTSLQPFSYPDTVYAPHSYDADAEQGKGFAASRREELIYRIGACAREAKALQSALWVGEYGGNQDHPGITEYMDAQFDGAGAVAASTMYWQYGKDNGSGLLYPDGSEKKTLLGVLVRPYPERVAGDPVSYTYEEKTRTFTLVYIPDRRVAAPTVIAVPARVYGSGYQVVCHGCKVERATGQLLVLAPPPAGPARATITIRP